MRNLATIRVIKEITEIPGANSIELVRVDGWHCVAKKGEFKTGDWCVYFEIDSILPDHPVFEFMRSRKFRVKTIKCMKHISQGLAMPFSIMTNFTSNLKPSDLLDVTSYIGVKKHDPEAAKEEEQNKSPRIPLPIWKQLALRYLPKSISNWLTGKVSGSFPKHIVGETDEVRYQNLKDHEKKALITDTLLEVTEKLDGTSTTFIYRPRHWLLKWLIGDEFLVCSRHLTKVHEDNSWWWEVARNEKIKSKMSTLYDKMQLEEGKYLIIQGETIGPGIRENKYKRTSLEFYCFNFMTNLNGRVCKFGHADAGWWLEKVDIKQVPRITCKNFFEGTVEELDEFVYEQKRQSTLYPALKISEGVVIRSANQNDSGLNSFKYVFPEYSEKLDKDSK